MKLSTIKPLAALLLGLAIPGTSLAKDQAPAEAANQPPEIAAQSWTFSGPFGTYDNAQLQRGFQIYKEVCSNCHSMRLLSYRNLGEPGGPEFPPKAVATIASQVQVTDGPNEKGCSSAPGARRTISARRLPTTSRRAMPITARSRPIFR